MEAGILGEAFSVGMGRPIGKGEDVAPGEPKAREEKSLYTQRW
jgi:hypothetical protein